ncbi:MAG: DUF4347 domain-containing protein [Cyanobacteria bacterium J06632_3]
MSSASENNLIQPGALENLDELSSLNQDAFGLPDGAKKAPEMPFGPISLEITQPVSSTAIGDFDTQTNLVVEAWHQDESTLPTFNSNGEQVDALLGLPGSETDADYALSGFSTETDTLTNTGNATPSYQQIVFVDGSVTNSDQLIAELTFSADVVYLDSTRDGVTQISEALSAREGVAAVHIVTHGAAGSLQLGSTTLDSATLENYQAQLQGWAGSLTEHADILIYGCDVASTLGGQAFVDRIGQWTGADVAASDDLTGNVALGADWELEYQRGVIDARSLSSTTYQETLASVSLSDTGKLSYKDIDETKNNLSFSIVNDKIIIQENTSSDYTAITAGSGVTQIDDYQVSVDLSSVSSLNIDTGSFLDTITFSSGWSSVVSALDVNIDTGDDDDIVIFDSDFNTQGGALSISTGAGKDKIKVSSSLYTQGGDIDFAANTIMIDAGQTLSTRNILDGGDHSTSGSIGNSGGIQLTGEKITIGDSVSAETQLLAQVEGYSAYSAGDIKIKVSETEEAATLFDGVEQSIAELTLSQVVLKGKDVVLSASADYSETLEADDLNNAQDFFDETGEILPTFFDSFSLFLGAAYSKSTAKILVDNKTAIVANTLDASATAITNSTIMPLLNWLAGGAYARADSTAIVSFEGQVDAAGDVSISTLTDNTVDVQVSSSKWDNSNALTSSSFAVAVSELYSKSTVKVKDDAIIQSGGNVSITANTIDRNMTVAASNPGSDGTVSTAVAVSVEDGKTNALVEGSVTAAGDITVEASQANEETESILTGGSAIVSGSGVRAYAGLSNLTADTGGGIAGSLAKGAFSGLKSLFSSASKTASSQTQGRVSSFQMGAGTAYVEDTNTVMARIGGQFEDGDDTDTTAATVTSQGGDITVHAKVDNRPDVSASSLLENKGDLKTDPSSASASSQAAETTDDEGAFAGSVGVAIGDYQNTARAYIGNGAVVNAAQDLSVKSETINDYSVEWGVNLVDPWQTDDDWTTKSANFIGNLAGYFNGNLGLDEYVFDSWSQATASTDATLAAAGAVTILTLDHTSKAYIDSNALINQDASLRSGQQNVTVKAISVNESVHFGGNLAMPGIYWSNTASTLEFSAGGFGGNASNAVGGSALILNYVNDVSAKVEDGVSLYADSLKVKAESKTMNIDVAASGGKSETFGFSGVGAWVFVDNETTAQIAGGASLEIGDNLIGGTTDSLIVEAEDTVDSFNILGSVAVSESIGAGASVGLNSIKRKTRAVIGALDDSDSTEAVRVQSAGDVEVNAENSGYIGSFSLASAIATGGETTTNSDGSK